MSDRHVRARVVVLAASALESARLLLNSKSSMFPNGLANSSGQVGKWITDTTGVSVSGYIPSMVDQGLDTVKKYRIKVRPLTRGDFETAAKLIHPQTTKEEMQKYYNWKESAEEQ
jgi:choline dehydrogenase-like flavoprotein